MLFPLPAPEQGGKIWKITLSVWKNWRKLQTLLKVVHKSFAIQAGREIRIMLRPDLVNDDQMVILAREIVKKIENELDYPGQIKVNCVRENRAIEYAK